MSIAATLGILEKVPAELEGLLKGRFQNPKRFKRSKEDPEGMELILTTENGNVMLDFGEPVQALGMTIDDLKGLMLALAHAGAHASAEADEKTPAN
jgi:hypothetical protein